MAETAHLNLAKYVGEWVVICDERVVAHNTDLTKLDDDIRRCKKQPTIAKIPKEEALIF